MAGSTQDVPTPTRWSGLLSSSGGKYNVQCGNAELANPASACENDDEEEDDDDEAEAEVNSSVPATQRSPFQPYDLERGEKSEQGMQFVPFTLVRKYPYLWVGKTNSDLVEGFFNRNLLNRRVWDLFYLYNPATQGEELLLFVPTIQFEQFLAAANLQLKINLAIPRGPHNRESFYMTFGDLGMPRPRYLGRINNAAGLSSIMWDLPQLHPDDDLQKYAKTHPVGVQNYHELIEKVLKSWKPSKGKKDPKAVRRKIVDRQKGWSRMTKRTQRYLGLRLRNHQDASEHIPPEITWNPSIPALFDPERQVRFVCVDVEAWEKNQDIVTEIGIAVLDTEKIAGIAPGQRGENWLDLIHAWHIRVDEYSSMVNSQYVQGCPDKFDFGQSEFIERTSIAPRLDNIIGQRLQNGKKPIVFVGHDVIMDLKYLMKVGYNMWKLPDWLDEIDTKDMYARLAHNPNGRRLEFICDQLGIPGKNFHNAGNDAVYTLRAMIAIALRQLTQGQNTDEVVNAAESARGAGDGEWSDGEADDGGNPERSDEPPPPHPRRPARQQQW